MPDLESYIRDKAETLPRAQIDELKLDRLRAGINRITGTVPFYAEKFKEAGVAADDIRSLADLTRLPFTTKNDLRENYPFGLLAVPMKEVVRVHASSGTTGKPTVVAYTRGDLELWSQMMARVYAAAGVTKD